MRNVSMSIKAVLFDLDGIIVDTIHYHYLAWNHMFTQLGGSVSKHSVLLHEGRASREILPTFLREAGVTLPEEEHEDFIDRKRKYYRSIVQVSVYPGVFEVIDELRARGFATALVTASARSNMNHALDETQRRRFDVIVTGDEVRKAKPNPDPYLQAMERLGLTPRECLVVENAPLGIESAKNAGMFCVAIETTLERSYLGLADVILRETAQLPALPELQKAAVS